MGATLTVGPQPAAAAAERNELRALSELGFDELRRLAGGIRDIHLGVSGRVFKAVGPSATPSRVIHDGISRAAYGALASGASMLGRTADEAIERRGLGEGVAIFATPPGGALIGFVTGLIGDQLERSGSDLHEPASLRVHGHVVPPEAPAVRAAYPDAGTRLVVFLHGLMGTEFTWRWGAADDGHTYASLLRRDLGLTPLELRYNTGLRISENGRQVGALIERIVAAWPVEVEQIALVGHSMGGLVARSACHQAEERGAAWPARVRHIVCLGTPHLGAPLEQGVHRAAHVLSAMPETRPFGTFLRRRSGGIRDLRHGSLVDEDWHGRDPDALRAAAMKEVPLHKHATHYLVSATITASPRHPLGRLLGDLLVLGPSATGRSRARHIPFDLEAGHHHVGPATHFTLLNDARVYERLSEWLR